MEREKKLKEDFGAEIAKKLYDVLSHLEDKKIPEEERKGKFREIVSSLEFIIEEKTDQEIINGFYNELNKIFPRGENAVSLELKISEMLKIISYKTTWRIILQQNEIAKIENEKTIKKCPRPRGRPPSKLQKNDGINYSKIYKNSDGFSFFSELLEKSFWFQGLDCKKQNFLRNIRLAELSSDERQIITFLPYLWRGGISEKGLFEAEQITIAINQAFEFIEEADKEKCKKIIADLASTIEKNFLFDIIKETDIFNKENIHYQLEMVLKSFLAGKLKEISLPKISELRKNLFQILGESLPEALVKKIFQKYLD